MSMQHGEKISSALPPDSFQQPDAMPTQALNAAISPEALAEFRQLWLQEYGAELTPGEARIKAVLLVELFRVLLRPPS